MLASYFATLAITSYPTHVKGNTLDLVLVNDTALIKSLKVHSVSDCPLSTDHFMISFCLCHGVEEQEFSSPSSSPMVYDYPKADWVSLCDHIESRL